MAGNARFVLSSRMDEKQAREARSDLWKAYTTMVLLASRPALGTATKILAYVDRTVKDGVQFEVEGYRDLIWELQRTTRNDLIGVDDLHRTTPSQGRADVN